MHPMLDSSKIGNSPSNSPPWCLTLPNNSWMRETFSKVDLHWLLKSKKSKKKTFTTALFTSSPKDWKFKNDLMKNCLKSRKSAKERAATRRIQSKAEESPLKMRKALIMTEKTRQTFIDLTLNLILCLHYCSKHVLESQS